MRRIGFLSLHFRATFGLFCDSLPQSPGGGFLLTYMYSRRSAQAILQAILDDDEQIIAAVDERLLAGKKLARHWTLQK